MKNVLFGKSYSKRYQPFYSVVLGVAGDDDEDDKLLADAIIFFCLCGTAEDGC